MEFRDLNADHIPADEFDTANGFEVTVWATTPKLFNPTNFDIDADGRIWVAEAVIHSSLFASRNGKGDTFVSSGVHIGQCQP